MGNRIFLMAPTRLHCLVHPVSHSSLNVRDLLHQYDLHPNKRLGQVFLVDERSLKRIVDAAQLSPENNVLEIGPGLGSLTRHLARKTRLVVAVEIDVRLIPPLEQVLAPYPNVRIIQGDILSLDPSVILENEEYLVVANIPYYITSQVIRHLLENQNKPQRIVLTIQREVAERICAEPGKMSLLALSVQVYGQPMITSIIPAKAFYPKPKVDSAVVRVELFHDPLIPRDQLDAFFQLIKAGFSQKRKTLRNAISAGIGIEPNTAIEMLTGAKIDPGRRAETLSMHEWRTLTANYLLQKHDL
jgi:16S rRNA (adenine1518-N6/adenine1519-N6)-dimethyltransferase